MPNSTDDITKGKVRRAYKAGDPIAKIASDCGCSIRTVRNLCGDLKDARDKAIARLKAIAKQNKAEQSKTEARADAQDSGLVPAPQRQRSRRRSQGGEDGPDPTVIDIDQTIDDILAAGGLKRMDLLLYHCSQAVLRSAASSKEGMAGAYIKMEAARHKYYPRTMRELADYMLELEDLDVNELMKELYRKADKAG